MPRPKRTKVASTVQPTRVARATTRRNAPSTTSERDESIGDNIQVVAASKPQVRKGRGAGPSKETQYMMSGALPEGDAKGSRRTITRARPAPKKKTTDEAHTNALEALKARRDAAKKAQEPKTTAPAAATPQPAAPASKAPARTPEETTVVSSPTQTPVDRVPFSAQASALRVRATPGGDGSILALGNFKRRPRQPSILRMVQQTSDIEHGDFDDIDDFNPDDESTPLNLGKVTAPNEESAGPSSSAARSSSSRKRKLASPQIQVPRSSPPLLSSPAPARESSRPSSDPPSLPEHVEATQEEERLPEQDRQSPEIFSETLAPPRSSSPSSHDRDTNGSASPLKHRGRPRRAAREVVINNDDNNDDEDEDEDEDATRDVIEVKPLTKTRKPATTKQPKPRSLSTAALQSLLPRRRHRNRPPKEDVFNITSSDTVEPLDSEEDELSAPTARRTTSSRRTTTTTKTPAKGNMAKNMLKRRANAAAKGGGKETPSTGKTARTYSRRASDKENESSFAQNDSSEDEDEDITTEPPSILASKSAELAAAAKKFAEVDEWDLEFESVDLGGDSSPWR